MKMLRMKKDRRGKAKSLPIQVIFQKVRLTKTDNELQLLSSLDAALERREIHQLYQPIVDITGRLFSLEVLMRWNKNGQFIPPDVFIPIAEGAGHIHKLWKRSLDDAVR